MRFPRNPPSAAASFGRMRSYPPTDGSWPSTLSCCIICAAEDANGVRTIRVARLGVIQHGAAGRVPDLDAQPVRNVLTDPITVDRGDEEGVTCVSIHATRTVKLRFRAGDHEPVVCRAVEREAIRLEAEARLREWDGPVLLISGEESEERPTRSG